jgi:hypothetical protein
MGSKGKITKKLTEKKEVIHVKLFSYTRPQFAHNASKAGKDEMVWKYNFWKTTDENNVGEFTIEGDVGKMKDMKEQKQSETMNAAAIALVENQYKDCTVKLVA